MHRHTDDATTGSAGCRAAEEDRCSLRGRQNAEPFTIVRAYRFHGYSHHCLSLVSLPSQYYPASVLIYLTKHLIPFQTFPDTAFSLVTVFPRKIILSLSTCDCRFLHMDARIHSMTLTHSLLPFRCWLLIRRWSMCTCSLATAVLCVVSLISSRYTCRWTHAFHHHLSWKILTRVMQI